jgi:WD40 repeat protein
MIFDDNTKCIVAAGNKCEIYFVEMFTYEHKNIFKGHTDSVNCLALDGKILFSGSDDKTIRLWDTVSNQFLTYIDGHDNGINDLLII